jgi:hypothetical protein
MLGSAPDDIRQYLDMILHSQFCAEQFLWCMTHIPGQVAARARHTNNARWTCSNIYFAKCIWYVRFVLEFLCIVLIWWHGLTIQAYGATDQVSDIWILLCFDSPCITVSCLTYPVETVMPWAHQACWCDKRRTVVYLARTLERYTFPTSLTCSHHPSNMAFISNNTRWWSGIDMHIFF